MADGARLASSVTVAALLCLVSSLAVAAEPSVSDAPAPVDAADRAALTVLVAELPTHGVVPPAVPDADADDAAWRGVGEALVEVFGPTTLRRRARRRLIEGTRPLAPAIRALVPRHRRYLVLQQRLRALTAGLASDVQVPIRKPPGYQVRVGRTAPEVAQLRQRLRLEGYGDENVKGRLNEYYDHRLKRALWAWQQDHGLPMTIYLDHFTRRKLNEEVAPLVSQLALALARWRAVDLREDTGKHLLVHINRYELVAEDDGDAAFAMPVIVGKATPADQTPITSAPVEHVVTHPAWRVPKRIIRRELRPRAGDVPENLEADGYDVTVDDDGRWRVRLPPGPENPLGTLKFTLVGTDGVYLHDTSAPERFKDERRALSHGCVRLSDPRRVAEWALDEQTDVLEAALTAGETKRLSPGDPVRAHLIYQTLTVDDAGRIERHPDVYGWDAPGLALIDGPSLVSALGSGRGRGSASSSP